jgi:type IV secretory pathway VirB3-like protein
MAKEEPKEHEIGTGEETAFEQAISNYISTGIHLFLSLVALLLIVAAVIATYDTVVRGFPLLWQPQDQYTVLQTIVENLLLIAIAAEFALLLLFRRMSAVVEVVVFVLARKAVNPDIHAFELMLLAAAIAGLIVLRFYYLPGKTT